MSERRTTLLEVRDVSKHFGGIYALNEASLVLESGEVHALIGPNGAGKTTLIHVLSGALPADAGQVIFDGNDLARRAMHERVALGLARSYQITNLFSRLKVLDNVTMAVQSRVRDWGSSFSFWKPFSLDSAIVDEAHDLLAQVSLTGLAGRRASQLSHGEQRCLEVALVLATKPKLLLLDEPMAGMGPEESVRMVELIEHLARRVTMLLVEHDMDAVFRLADRISVLVGGRVIASGEPAVIRADHEVRRAYLGDAE
ncbi:MAG: ABC transporter ATP-binding protein [Propionivibrio sp.]|uniref:ABC transporter ATP-binding protein n=1 Tax=Candidatus Propionivibrio dominans TaxID=2954373 RepID=A0A9D7FB29_9RHOO|nr:ABC transporter ATP-binding protein [Candidatus Propionivibrio dominans]